MNKVRLALSDMGAVSAPYTVGAFRQLDSDRVIKVGLPGVADILACHNGRFVAVEVKVDRDRQRPEQRNFQAAIEAAGGVYVVARFTEHEDGVETLRSALERPPCEQCGKAPRWDIFTLCHSCYEAWSTEQKGHPDVR